MFIVFQILNIFFKISRILDLLPPDWETGNTEKMCEKYYQWNTWSKTFLWILVGCFWLFWARSMLSLPLSARWDEWDCGCRWLWLQSERKWLDLIFRIPANMIAFLSFLIAILSVIHDSNNFFNFYLFRLSFISFFNKSYDMMKYTIV